MFAQPDVDQEQPLVKQEPPDTKESPNKQGTGDSAASRAGSPHGASSIQALLDEAASQGTTEESLEAVLAPPPGASGDDLCYICRKRKRAAKQKTCVVCKSDVQAARREAEKEGESAWFAKLVSAGGSDLQDPGVRASILSMSALSPALHVLSLKFTNGSVVVHHLSLQQCLCGGLHAQLHSQQQGPPQVQPEDEVRFCQIQGGPQNPNFPAPRLQGQAILDSPDSSLSDL